MIKIMSGGDYFVRQMALCHRLPCSIKHWGLPHVAMLNKTLGEDVCCCSRRRIINGYCEFQVPATAVAVVPDGLVLWGDG